LRGALVIETELLTLISNYGFPIVISLYLLITRDKIIQKNTEAIDKLSDVISEMKIK
jgi:hypothetical protein